MERDVQGWSERIAELTSLHSLSYMRLESVRSRYTKITLGTIFRDVDIDFELAFEVRVQRSDYQDICVAMGIYEWPCCETVRLVWPCIRVLTR